MSPRARNLCAVILLLCIGAATVRIALAAQGQPDDRLALALAVISGVSGLVGFTAYALRRRRP